MLNSAEMEQIADLHKRIYDGEVSSLQQHEPAAACLTLSWLSFGPGFLWGLCHTAACKALVELYRCPTCMQGSSQHEGLPQLLSRLSSLRGFQGWQPAQQVPPNGTAPGLPAPDMPTGMDGAAALVRPTLFRQLR